MSGRAERDPLCIHARIWFSRVVSANQPGYVGQRREARRPASVRVDRHGSGFATARLRGSLLSRLGRGIVFDRGSRSRHRSSFRLVRRRCPFRLQSRQRFCLLQILASRRGLFMQVHVFVIARPATYLCDLIIHDRDNRMVRSLRHLMQ